MTIKELVSKISKLEGKKHQASVGDVREIIALVCDELVLDKIPNATATALVKNGQRRAKRRKK